MSRRNRREPHRPPPMRPRELPPEPQGEWRPNDTGTAATLAIGGARATVGWLELAGLVRWAILGADGLSCHGFVEVPLERENGPGLAIAVARELVESVIGVYAQGFADG